MSEINFLEYIRRFGEDEFYSLAFAAQYEPIRIRYAQLLNENGWQNSPFADVLAALRDKSADGQDVTINGYKLNFESFGQTSIFDPDQFRMENVFDLAFLHFARNVTTDYTLKYHSVIQDADRYLKASDVKKCATQKRYSSNNYRK